MNILYMKKLSKIHQMQMIELLGKIWLVLGAVESLWQFSLFVLFESMIFVVYHSQIIWCEIKGYKQKGYRKYNPYFIQPPH